MIINAAWAKSRISFRSESETKLPNPFKIIEILIYFISIYKHFHQIEVLSSIWYIYKPRNSTVSIRSPRGHFVSVCSTMHPTAATPSILAKRHSSRLPLHYGSNFSSIRICQARPTPASQGHTVLYCHFCLNIVWHISVRFVSCLCKYYLIMFEP